MTAYRFGSRAGDDRDHRGRIRAARSPIPVGAEVRWSQTARVRRGREPRAARRSGALPR